MSPAALRLLAWLEGRGAVPLREWMGRARPGLWAELLVHGCIAIEAGVVCPVETEYSYLLAPEPIDLAPLGVQVARRLTRR